MIGHTLGGRYELLARIGGGGMALVYKARDNLLNRFVAVKVLRQQFMHDDDFVKRFRREAQAAASLSHPNIVSIYDVGQEEDTHYIVMEYVDGPNLNEIIRERAPLQADEAVRIAGQIADALDHAHHHQIIHRDIKPHNILIGSNGRVKVTDFGIARAVTSSTITQTGSVVGSVHYFSPEHAKGVSTGEKSDIYSLGIVLYQMLTGRLPFLGESPISVALKHLQDPFEEPRQVNPHIPQSVENIILRAMRKNPQERYQSAKQMLADLETCLQPQRLHEPPVRFASDDDSESDKTRVIPAIKPDMRNTLEAPAAKRADAADERWDSRGLEEKRRGWVTPTVLGVLAAVLIGVLLWAVFALKGALSPKDVMVPSVVGMKLDEAKAKLEATGLKWEDPVVEEASTEEEKGRVVKQNKVDIEVKEGSLIRLTVGTGPDLPTMPGVTGKSFDEAKAALQDLGVDEAKIERVEVFDDSEPGTVLEQDPAEGTQFNPAEEKIYLKVSKGKKTFPMPKLVDKKESQARAELLKYGLKLKDDKVNYEPSYSVPKGTVFKQFPVEQDQSVTEGMVVELWVSSGYPTDAKEVTYDVTVAPAVEGQESEIVIMYSDATGDNKQAVKKKIKSMTTFKVKLVLAPGKDGQITVYRDGEYVNNTPVPYEVQPAGNTVTPPGDGNDQGN
ncbi:Stk1 family PASTA domain-containing Ser/Thr kinase [Cohnella pontilimi]|uniref:Serine/threonine-protein kinase PrkC n=1 Tax=Cohnella pontilimi TaxID=2564100 RepID=A0A4U0FEK4_9BACL|nr:Stk1 family PASTA domain-containing Ser/Thr kinase [Cohnella pontilimi]TJY43251.1 Stk1 family PASTA domain-containing Ser/Thr kinase [Cohnella pontilimi]